MDYILSGGNKELKFDYIINAVNEIIETVGSRNLEDICSYYNILIRRHDLQKKLKAYFYYNCI